MKSDDVVGRVKAYEAIVKGQNIPTPGVPESFKVLVRELQSLALDIQILDNDGNEIRLKDYSDDTEMLRNIPGSSEDFAKDEEYVTNEDELAGSFRTGEADEMDSDADLDFGDGQE